MRLRTLRHVQRLQVHQDCTSGQYVERVRRVGCVQFPLTYLLPVSFLLSPSRKTSVPFFSLSCACLADTPLLRGTLFSHLKAVPHRLSDHPLVGAWLWRSPHEPTTWPCSPMPPIVTTTFGEFQLSTSSSDLLRILDVSWHHTQPSLAPRPRGGPPI